MHCSYAQPGVLCALCAIFAPFAVKDLLHTFHNPISVHPFLVLALTRGENMEVLRHDHVADVPQICSVAEPFKNFNQEIGGLVRLLPETITEMVAPPFAVFERWAPRHRGARLLCQLACLS